MRVRFNGALNGSVTVRKGETPEQALARAEAMLLEVMDRHAKSLGSGDGHGPNIGLELED